MGEEKEDNKIVVIVVAVVVRQGHLRRCWKQEPNAQDAGSTISSEDQNKT